MADIAIRSAEIAQSGFEATLEDFIRYLDIRPASLRTYINGVKAYWAYLKANGLQPTRESVINFRNSLAGQRKASTIQTYMAGVKRFFNWLADTGRLPSNPAAGVKGVKQKKGFKKDCLTAAQANELLASIDTESLAGKRDYAMLILMLSAGLRDCEAARAKISDVQTIGGQSALYVHGKGQDEADAPIHLTPRVEKAIRQYLMARRATDGNAPLFGSVSNRNAANKPLTTRSISRIIKARLQAIGLDSERLTAHSLRHTAATLNLLAGGSLEETQELLRHSSITTTQIYAHHLRWSERQAEQRIIDAIFA